MNKDLELIILGLTLTAPITQTVRAEIYFKEDQVVKSIFPEGEFEGQWIELTPEQINLIEKASGESVRDKKVRVWKNAQGEMVFIDRVVGKHDFITYAVGINDGGKVKKIEVMEYRETYGHEVRKPEWREQFAGKDLTAPLKLNKDIKNISGATLSSAHLTAGVRRILHTYDCLKNNS
jgi:Na+-translocating ferredoxin:NAD+ oxidoreductase RnfG subunit